MADCPDGLINGRRRQEMDGVGRRSVFPSRGETVGVLVRPHSVCVSVGNSEVYTFEPSGRLHAAFDRGHHFRRGLDGRVLESWRILRDGRQVKCERRLEVFESHSLVEHIHQRVSHLLSGRPMAGRLAAWNREKYMADAARYRSVYGSVGILPPDHYLSVVVQATRGCPWNRCAFCDFYRELPFRIRSRDELEDHIAGVRAFLGAGLAMRRAIFLGDANALSVPFPALREMFSAVKAGFPEGVPGPSWRQVFAFLDVFGGNKRTSEEISELKAMGLRRVYLGLETGHDALLARVNKRGKADQAIGLVRRLKRGGVQVGVIVLLGLGGEAYADEHVRETVRVLNQMGLGRGDLVFFSELVTASHLPYAEDMRASRIRALTADEMARQRSRIESGLIFSGLNPPKTAPYNLRRFVF